MTDTDSAPIKDMLDPARAQAMAATLARPAPGGTLPPFWHHAYFWEPYGPADLGRDGHPRQGLGPVPDTGFPRRMWAGGELHWHAPLRLGEAAQKRTRLVQQSEKHGRSGAFMLVRLEHRIEQDDQLALTEWQDLVYRPEPSGAAGTPPLARDEGEVMAPIPTDPVTLFRYSALTFNGHRIHYDAAYATGVEGHAGVVVHGPLLAEALIHAAGPVTRFRYRATAPLFAGERGEVCREGNALWVRGPEGRLCMTGEVLDESR